MRWIRDERTGMYWCLPDPPALSPAARARLFDPAANIRAAMAYMRDRYSSPVPWRSWRSSFVPSPPEVHLRSNADIDRMEGGDGREDVEGSAR